MDFISAQSINVFFQNLLSDRLPSGAEEEKDANIASGFLFIIIVSKEKSLEIRRTIDLFSLSLIKSAP